MPQPTTTQLTFSDAGVPWAVEDWSAALHPPTVLVVDDDESIRDLISVKLQAAGYHTLEAGDGHAAMALAVNERPHLILLDITMPGLDGIGFCYQLHSSPQTADIPVIIVSSHGTPSDVDLGRIVGAEDYVVKPFSPADLLRRVQRLLPPGD
ncbi:hypothetical protein GCM10010112_88340 [Actinoplanes lobatus]|uniref:DNA-binding response OmpR family regulator n=1 Tax=Actinoplanes lobatus TaxID=113568 RepID=A0A7W7MHP5_9ACTN|nr:response regulator [Actinoplanes lobatus]MBB4750571.1 DNA-binding response OmpR family regulator [Actinoplanes lobatus]GGN96777.1 hypothetical protein GCM10010112_88340 [Actinoplanes lobatus]GIE45494.1 hypothetical protein Alo02nite_83920 [Actinoplanes lobatus]